MPRTCRLWIACVVCLLAACAAPPAPTPTALSGPTQTATAIPPTPTPFRSATPLPTRTPLPSVTPTTGAPQTKAVSVVASPTRKSPAVTAAPSSTSALLALTPAQATLIPTQAQPQPGSPPPLDMKLPQGWTADYRVMPTRDVGVQSTMSAAIYAGPVPGGRAHIILLWGFPSIVAPPTRVVGTQNGTPGLTVANLLAQALWADGLRLLEGTVIDINCTFGIYGQRDDFTIGKLPAVAGIFAASQCEADPDTAGWFAGVNQAGANYLFYMYFDPPQAYNTGRADVQKILDTVTFHTPGATPPPTNTSAATTTPVLR